MLYSPSQFARDQLLTDLLAVRQRIEAKWAKGKWGNNSGACIIGTVQLALGEPVGFAPPAATGGERQVRLGRALAAIYMALYGPHAPTNVTISQVMTKIMGFNDVQASHASVVLLLDRAIAAVHEQAGVTVTATG